ncbi:MAG: lamin tail domain-containing protein [Kofleriaceae bacterium]|nr:lamin tail domain-containing protein [Kofleriaceae bacterium]
MRTSAALLGASLLLASACTDEVALQVDGGFDAAEVGQGSIARGPLVINEVMPKPAEGADWIELYNRSDAAIDLCDYFVTDSLDRLDHYFHLGGSPPPQECPVQLLDVGEYLIVIADDDAPAGHAPFKLGIADQAHVVSLSGEAIDSLIYLYPANGAGMSLARQPNGEGSFWLVEASEGQTNPDVPTPDVGGAQ